jgi:hypothetical protein
VWGDFCLIAILKKLLSRLSAILGSCPPPILPLTCAFYVFSSLRNFPCPLSVSLFASMSVRLLVRLCVCLPVCLPLSVRLPLCPTPSSSSLSSLACRAQCVYVAYFILVVQLSFAAPSSLRAQLSAAAPPRRSTCWHALRKRFAMFLATACAFEVLMTLLTLAV